MSRQPTERDAAMRRYWGRYLDADAPTEDLLTELQGLAAAMPNAQCADLVPMLARVTELADELRKRHAHVSALLLAFCNLAIGRKP